MGKTRIPYATDTWDPVTGCTPVGEGCRNCWAAALARRLPATHGGYEGCLRCRGKGTMPITGLADREVCGTCQLTGEVPIPFSRLVLHADRLEQPLHWRKPRVVLVCSRGDLFHDAVPDEFIFRVCRTIAAAPHHRYLLLTKRWERMSGMVLPMLEHLGANGDPVWWGFSAWDNDSAKRVAEIVRNRFMQCDQVWLSLEPLLGPVDLGEDMGLFNFVVAGCESGAARRLAHWYWFDAIWWKCREAKVPYYGKQRPQYADGTGKVIRLSPQPGELPWRLPAKGA